MLPFLRLLLPHIGDPCLHLEHQNFNSSRICPSKPSRNTQVWLCVRRAEDVIQEIHRLELLVRNPPHSGVPHLLVPNRNDVLPADLHFVPEHALYDLCCSVLALQNEDCQHPRASKRVSCLANDQRFDPVH
jgi:hypothetical protein